MPKSPSADEIFLLVDQLSHEEQLRLLQLIARRLPAADSDAYRALPPRNGEFSSDDEPLAWDSGGWEGIA